MRHPIGPLTVLLALSLSARPNPAQDREKKEPPKVELTDAEKEIVELTNKERAKEGLPALKVSPVLCNVARAHSANMAKQAKVDHVLDGKSFPERTKDAGYAFLACGENIAHGREGSTPKQLFAWWMSSKIHRENILRKEFTEIGVGVRTEKDGVYATQLFASPAR
jgi:uncharacterized protein YkwD